MTEFFKATVGRLDQAIREGTLIRKKWAYEISGRRYACLLASMVPECGEESSAAPCPAWLMPRWMARLTPWIDDAGSIARWQDVVREYAELIRASEGMPDTSWARLDLKIRHATAVEFARSCPHHEELTLKMVGVLRAELDGEQHAGRLGLMAALRNHALEEWLRPLLEDGRADIVEYIYRYIDNYTGKLGSTPFADAVTSAILAAWREEVDAWRRATQPIPELGEARAVQDETAAPPAAQAVPR